MTVSLPNLAQFRRGMASEAQAWQRANLAAVKEQAEAIKESVRAEVRAAFPKGARVANAVRARLYDNGARGAAGLVWSKFGRKAGSVFQDFIGARLFGAEIRPVKGKWLAIPIHWGRARQKSKRLAAAKLLAQDRLRFVPLRGGKTALLVWGTKRKSVPVYLLVRKVSFPRRLQAGQFLARAEKDLPGRIARSYGRNRARA